MNIILDIFSLIVLLMGAIGIVCLVLVFFMIPVGWVINKILYILDKLQ